MRAVVAVVIVLTTVVAGGFAVDRPHAATGRSAPARPHAPPGAEVVGRSAEGRAIFLIRRGDPAGAVTILVVGSIHGTEPAGGAVIGRLRRVAVPSGVRLLLVPTANPDGLAQGTRQNARGVDLNRNFPYRWRPRGRAFDTFFTGRGPASEPETRALQRLVERERPDVTIWFHQALRLVTLVPGADEALIRAYGRRVGLPARELPHYRGTATSWQNRTFPGTSAFVVELPAGPLPADAAARHARAVEVAAASAGGGTPTRSARPTPLRGLDSAVATPAQAAAPRPPIEWRPIPFGPERRRETRAYSRRHYGDDTARLRDPKAIVEHYTASTSYASAWNTFASDAPDVELHELPGVCAHFLIDRDGTITQLVALTWRCRHTIGLNHVAIGIEHVGTSDADVMGNGPQLRASLRLTRWLQDRFGIATRDVIGHAESLSSPYHHELVPALRDRTHGDFAGPTMRRYRARLAAARAGAAKG
jgi:N-acetylmuramoyl-L-alanine amidase